MSITLRPRNQADSADFLVDVKSLEAFGVGGIREFHDAAHAIDAVAVELGDYIKEHEPNRMYSKVHTKPSLER